MGSVLALHPAASGSNLRRDLFSLLLSLWTVLRSNPTSAKSEGLSQAQQKVFLLEILSDERLPSGLYFKATTVVITTLESLVAVLYKCNSK